MIFTLMTMTLPQVPLLKLYFFSISRANRAQYAEVSFQSVTDSDIFDVSLPSMQGADEYDGRITFLDV